MSKDNFLRSHFRNYSLRLRWEIQQLQLENQRLTTLIGQDPLTQLANRRRFMESWQQEWQRMIREKRSLALLLCDVDHFKTYNDTYGYWAGDRCLIQVANVLRYGVERPADIVARYGGEEFVLLLPNTPANSAQQVADTLCDRVANLAIPHNTSSVYPFVTISIGVGVVVPSRHLMPEDLFQAANSALMAAKREGKNQVVVFGV